KQLVQKGLLDRKYSAIMRNFYTLQKKILYRDVKEITGAQYDALLRDAQDFVSAMEKFIVSK
ncbi:MAG: hypothetical protein HY544_04965, partial [Candidatus Diapherotrites archaeon]|nr:hypothetical protein [Candidatus Diapherotrites archaeon]